MSKVKNKFCEDHFFFGGTKRNIRASKKKTREQKGKKGARKEIKKEGRQAGRKE